jgi:hypothetical protein
MPLATRKPTAQPLPAPALPVIAPDDYKNIVVDDNATRLGSLVTYMEGAPWTVDFYGQVTGRDSDLKDLDTTQAGQYQQYSKIIGMEIRVSQALNFGGQDNETSIVSVTGSGLIYPFLTPNVGDLFIADATPGRKGLFRINNVERKTFNRDAAFAIDYDLMCFTDVDVPRIENLESKVIRSYYFDKDRMIENANPLLQPEEQQQLRSLRNFYRVLTEFYFHTFFVKEFSTLMLPGQNVSIYDAFLVDYILRIVDTFDAPEIRSVKNLGTQGEPFLQQNQFWAAMHRRDHSLLPYCNRRMGLVYTKSFEQNPLLHGIRYTKIKYIVYPIEGDQSLFSDAAPTMKPIAIESVVEAKSAASSIAGVLSNSFTQQNRSVPYIKPVLESDNYVLSASFYDGKTDQSLMEALVTQYMKGNAINVAELTALTNQYQKWGRLEQFYYIPILLTLIKATSNGLY